MVHYVHTRTQDNEYSNNNTVRSTPHRGLDHSFVDVTERKWEWWRTWNDVPNGVLKREVNVVTSEDIKLRERIEAASVLELHVARKERGLQRVNTVRKGIELTEWESCGLRSQLKMLRASSILSLSTTLLVLLLSRWFIDELRRRTSPCRLRCEGEEGGVTCEGEEGGGICEGGEGAGTLVAPATVSPLPTVTVWGRKAPRLLHQSTLATMCRNTCTRTR